MNILYSIIGLFALGALIGMYLLSLVLRNRETPKAVAVTHGAFVVIALIMLINYISNNSPGPVESLVLFVMAALGGIVLAYRDFTGKKIPKWLAVTHGVLAISGFTLLLIFAFG